MKLFWNRESSKWRMYIKSVFISCKEKVGLGGLAGRRISWLIENDEVETFI